MPQAAACICPPGTFYFKSQPAGHVYLARHPRGAIKVGRTSNVPEHRVQNVNPFGKGDSRLIHVVSTRDAVFLETELHRILRPLQAEGFPGREWFRLPASVLAALHSTRHVCHVENAKDDLRATPTNVITFLNAVKGAAVRSSRRVWAWHRERGSVHAPNFAAYMKTHPEQFADLSRTTYHQLCTGNFPADILWLMEHIKLLEGLAADAREFTEAQREAIRRSLEDGAWGRRERRRKLSESLADSRHRTRGGRRKKAKARP